MGTARVIRTLAAALLIAALLLASACGSKSTSSTGAGATVGGGSSAVQAAPSAKHIRFAKTKFLLHAGLAFGAFHRYIYKPFKAGVFSHPLQHKLAVAKAAAAALFIVHEVGKAREDAQSSAVLRKLFAPLTALAATVATLSAGLKGGHADPAALGSVNGTIESIKHGASSAGAPVTEHTPALP
jgi:hypothetical protein